MTPRAILGALLVGLLCWAAIVLAWAAAPSLARALSRVVVTW